MAHTVVHTPHSPAAADCDPVLTAALLRVHTRASHPSCSRAGSAGTSNHSAYLDGQRQWSRRLWAGARAPPQPLSGIQAERAPRLKAKRGGPEQAGGHGRASVAAGCRMGSCEPDGWAMLAYARATVARSTRRNPESNSRAPGQGFVQIGPDDCRHILRRMQACTTRGAGLGPYAWRARAQRRSAAQVACWRSPAPHAPTPCRVAGWSTWGSRLSHIGSQPGEHTLG